MRELPPFLREVLFFTVTFIKEHVMSFRLMDKAKAAG